MGVEEKLAEFKNKLDPKINGLLESQIKEAAVINPKAVQMLEEIKRFINIGGKRVRPAFAYLGYISLGGQKETAIITLSMALEFLHTFALIHDDIIDNSDQRRGQKTTHLELARWHGQQKLFGDSDHYGLSVAILTGDLAYTIADRLFTEADFEADDLLTARRFWEKMKFEVLHGEFLDVLFSFEDKVSDADILSVLNYKTAKYTIERPLQIGASLASASDHELMILGRYGNKLGQAFQLHDDIEGIFGKEEKLGKSTSSDLIEGKKTLLISHAVQVANKEQRQVLLAVLGNHSASAEQLDQAREVIRDTQALQKAETVVQTLVDEAKASLKDLKLTEAGEKWLLEAADYLKLTV